MAVRPAVYVCLLFVPLSENVTFYALGSNGQDKFHYVWRYVSLSASLLVCLSAVCTSVRKLCSYLVYFFFTVLWCRIWNACFFGEAHSDNITHEHRMSLTLTCDPKWPSWVMMFLKLILLWPCIYSFKCFFFLHNQCFFPVSTLVSQQ